MWSMEINWCKVFFRFSMRVSPMQITPKQISLKQVSPEWVSPRQISFIARLRLEDVKRLLTDVLAVCQNPVQHIVGILLSQRHQGVLRVLMIWLPWLACAIVITYHLCLLSSELIILDFLDDILLIEYVNKVFARVLDWFQDLLWVSGCSSILFRLN